MLTGTAVSIPTVFRRRNPNLSLASNKSIQSLLKKLGKSGKPGAYTDSKCAL
jgi:hypothetical protein